MTCCVELIDKDLSSKLDKKAELFTLYFLALNKSNNIQDTAKLLIFIRGINDNFKITEQFLAMESLKMNIRGEDLYKQHVGGSGKT